MTPCASGVRPEFSIESDTYSWYGPDVQISPSSDFITLSFGRKKKKLVHHTPLLIVGSVEKKDVSG